MPGDAIKMTGASLGNTLCRLPPDTKCWAADGSSPELARFIRIQGLVCTSRSLLEFNAPLKRLHLAFYIKWCNSRTVTVAVMTDPQRYKMLQLTNLGIKATDILFIKRLMSLEFALKFFLALFGCI